MKLFTISLLVLASFGIGAQAQTETPAVKINLGTADKFALLGGSGITNVSAQTYIIGDVGSSPTPAITGLKNSQVKGQLYRKSNQVTAQAQKDLTVAYDEAAGASCPPNHDLTGEDLGGKRLGPGVYCFSSSAGLTGTLTLDALGNPEAQWVFQIGSTLTTATNSKVAIILGPKAPPWAKGLRGCNVYWQIGSSATIGGSSTFVGKILALTSITLDGGTFRGKGLARNGAVTMSARETVDGPACDSAVLTDGDGGASRN